ncbi:AraC family transcriptional regulator [Fulvivirga sp. RKSG066]|uniref:helix-turn-helix domain-containing protein n=1 Tax=Fulvivirga aurantia TaxID=2529383 RepID=UPI0012BCF0D5|nr:AraC family transcriptional regulator [Fulvivirga aurantia]MTI23263.1 AraC family transcriptional regulator [Fulvivirga aurantia]
MDERILKVLDYIEDHLVHSPGLQDLASRACLSPSQFHRLFKKETGKTPFLFIKEIKLNKAYQLLTLNHQSIADISSELGYKDYETFSRAFKKYFHIAPDDLKAIVGEIKKRNETTPEEAIYVTSTNTADQAEIKKAVAKLLKEKKLDINSIDDLKLYQVKKSSISLKTPGLIKKKFVMREDQRIWKSLIK